MRRDTAMVVSAASSNTPRYNEAQQGQRQRGTISSYQLVSEPLSMSQPTQSQVNLGHARQAPQGHRRSLSRRFFDTLTGVDALAREIDADNPPFMIKVKQGKEALELVKALQNNPQAKIALYYGKNPTVDLGGIMHQALSKASACYFHPDQQVFMETDTPNSLTWATTFNTKNAYLFGLVAGKGLTEPMVLENRLDHSLIQQIHAALTLMQAGQKPQEAIDAITKTKQNTFNALIQFEPATYQKRSMQDYALRHLSTGEIKALLVDHYTAAFHVAYGIKQVTSQHFKSVEILERELFSTESLKVNFQKIKIELNENKTQINPLFLQWFKNLRDEATENELQQLCTTITGCPTFSPNKKNITVKFHELYKSDKLFYARTCFNIIDFNTEIFQKVADTGGYDLFKALVLLGDDIFNAK